LSSWITSTLAPTRRAIRVRPPFFPDQLHDIQCVYTPRQSDDPLGRVAGLKRRMGRVRSSC
jgi:hypothetical protein